MWKKKLGKSTTAETQYDITRSGRRRRRRRRRRMRRNAEIWHKKNYIKVIIFAILHLWDGSMAHTEEEHGHSTVCVCVCYECEKKATGSETTFWLLASWTSLSSLQKRENKETKTPGLAKPGNPSRSVWAFLVSPAVCLRVERKLLLLTVK